LTNQKGKIFVRIAPVIAVVVSLSITACSTTNPNQNPGSDGVRIAGGGPVSSADMQKIKDQLVQNAKSSAVKSGAQQALAGEIRPGILVIGNVGSLRKLEGDVRHKFYDQSYKATAEKWHPGQAPAMSEAEFTTQVAGYTGIVLWSVPGVISGRRTAAVREIDIPKIDFPGPRMANFFGSTGDLVVASTNEDGAIWVDQVLCKDNAPDYSKCSDNFVRGVFDKNSGAELGSGMEPKTGGAHIDVATFRAIFK
jgi:hypothetical protein